MKEGNFFAMILSQPWQQQQAPALTHTLPLILMGRGKDHERPVSLAEEG
jgi:hypothetical protein